MYFVSSATEKKDQIGDDFLEVLAIFDMLNLLVEAFVRISITHMFKHVYYQSGFEHFKLIPMLVFYAVIGSILIAIRLSVHH